MTRISGDLSTALENLSRYENLGRIIDLQKFTEQIVKKYPNGPEIVVDNLKREYSDLYTALLLQGLSDAFRQADNPQATPEGVLNTFDMHIGQIPVEFSKSIGIKLCNLRKATLWDTLAEIAVLGQLTRHLTKYKIVAEYPLGIRVPGMDPPDADVAVLDNTGKPVWLNGAFTPKPSDFDSLSLTPEEIIGRIAEKYDKKFSGYCTSNPDAKVAIVLSLVKAEASLVNFLPHLLFSNTPVTLASSQLDSRVGLVYALACTFRSSNGRTLDICPIAHYLRE